MNTAFRQQIHDILQSLPVRRLDALKQLFWTELNYNHANDPVSTHDWPEEARSFCAEAPVIFAAGGDGDNFHILYTRLKSDRLPLGQERQIINRLIERHPYALYIFANEGQTHWHFVNVKLEPGNSNKARRVFRRITIGPEERLRTATERLALLDVSTISRDLFGIAPLAIQQRHDEAFDVEAVTFRFYSDYSRIFDNAEKLITGIQDHSTRRLFTQSLFNRLLFLVFLERKGWLILRGRKDYLQALWEEHSKEREKEESANFYRDRLKLLFFAGLNTPHEINVVRIAKDGFLQSRIGQVPYLNGGLFEEDSLDKDQNIFVPDEAIEPAIEDLFYHYNFTVSESTPLDVEVAVDPEMLGKIFEELVTGRHETGSYYTPKPVVAFMCREGLKGHLQTICPLESMEAINSFIDDREASNVKNPEEVLEALKSIRACDPACGSGAYLLGMLHELLDLRDALFVSRGLDPLTVYQRKLDIIQNNLYGVDIDPFAVNIARLRLWLSLIVDFEGQNPPPLPNLDFKIETGDSLTAPNPSGELQPDIFRHHQIKQYFALKSAYLMSHGEEKIALKQKISQLKNEIAAGTHPQGGQDGFDWVVEFAEVFSVQPLSQDTLTGKMGELIIALPGQMELAEFRPGKGGFDIILANPPYVRADAQYKNVEDEERRQIEIANWKTYRARLKKSKIYTTLHEKWDLYIPFLERAFQLLRPGGQMVFIISDAYNAAKYALKSHEFFLSNACIVRVDFCSDIPLFEAGVSNTIVHFSRRPPDERHQPWRYRRWGEKPEDFESNIETLPTSRQPSFGRILFRPDGQKAAIVTDNWFVSLDHICYISYGLRANSDDRYWQGEFVTADLISEEIDFKHPKPFIEGKDIARWWIRRIRYLEWGTERSPKRFARPTFPELHNAKEKLIALVVAPGGPPMVYDDRQLITTHTSCIFVPWIYLQGVINKSISKTARYHTQSAEGDREERENISAKFNLKFLLAIMNSSFTAKWLVSKRRSRNHVYPDDWKKLPIPPISLEQQQDFVHLVDAILDEYKKCGYPLPAEAQARVTELERIIDEKINALYEVRGASLINDS